MGLTVTVFVVLAVLLALASVSRPSGASPLHEVWRAFAQSRGGEYDTGVGGLDVVRVTLDGVPMVLKTLDIPGFEGERTQRTEVSARASLPEQVTISLRREGKIDKLAKGLGAQDVTFDDAPFDARFLVKAERDLGIAGVDENAGAKIAHAILNTDARRKLTAFPRTVTWTYQSGDVRLSWDGHEHDPAVLAAACAIVASTCRATAATGA